MRFTADVTSLVRALIAVPVLWFGIEHQWTLAFTLLLLGLATDVVDGWLARRFGSLRDTSPDFDADGIADSILLFVASFVPVTAYTGNARLVLAILWGVSLVVGILMVTGWGGPRQRAVIAFNMIVFHGVLQIGATSVWFAYMATGTVGAIIVAIVMTAVAASQRHKLLLWWNGRFA